jgi:hypothetical protein
MGLFCPILDAPSSHRYSLLWSSSPDLDLPQAAVWFETPAIPSVCLPFCACQTSTVGRRLSMFPSHCSSFYRLEGFPLTLSGLVSISWWNWMDTTSISGNIRQGRLAAQQSWFLLCSVSNPSWWGEELCSSRSSSCRHPDVYLISRLTMKQYVEERAFVTKTGSGLHYLCPCHIVQNWVTWSQLPVAYEVPMFLYAQNKAI